MKKFKYTAINLHGKKFQGSFLAESEDSLREQLAKQGLYLKSARAVTDKSPNPFFSLTGKVSVRELSAFARQFSIMISSGSSIVDSLAVLKGQAYTGFLKKVLDQVHESVKAGQLLSEAMSKHKRAFPNFFVSMVKIGELSGQLDTVLISIADYFESDAKLRARTKSALMYPAFLIVMAVALIVLMVALIIPTFRDALSSLNVEMPPLTIALYNISDAFRANWQYIALILVAVVALFLLFIRSRGGRVVWDRLKFVTPYVRDVIRGNIAARFCSAFSLLVAGGMDIADAMDEVVIVLGNKYVEQQFRRAAADVRQGMTLTMAMQSYNLFPPMLIQMLSVGEKTARIDEVLSRSSSFFESQVERSLTNLTGILQPLILLVIGACVGLLFYAVYAPLLQVMNTL